MVARDVRLTTRLGVSTASELSPDAGFPIARDHGNGDQKLDESDTPCSASYQVGPLAGIIPASCNAEAGRRNTPKRKAIRTSQKIHRQRRKTPITPCSTNRWLRRGCAIDVE